MDKKQFFEKARYLFTSALSVGAFGLNGFFLLMWKNQRNYVLVYVIFCIVVAYVITLVALHVTNRYRPQALETAIAKMRLIFRWLYVIIHLGVILLNIRQIGNGSIDFSNSKLVFQWVMLRFIALTIPRDILVRKAIAWVKQKWEERKAEQCVIHDS